jgi:thioesterase domain-containing protein/GT2 family glycosyltransferase
MNTQHLPTENLNLGLLKGTLTTLPAGSLGPIPKGSRAPCATCGGGLVFFDAPQGGEGDAYVLFVVHGLNGNVDSLRHLAAAVGHSGEGKIVGLQANGVSMSAGQVVADPCITCGGALLTTGTTVTDLATLYSSWIADVVRSQSSTLVPLRWAVGGYSGGGIVALEISRVLQVTHGLTTALPVVLLDCLPPHLDWPSWGRQVRQVRIHLRQGPNWSVGRALLPWLRRSIQNRTTRKIFPAAEARRQEAVSVALGHSDFAARGLVDLSVPMAAALEGHEVRTFDTDALLVQSSAIWPMFPDGYEWQSYVAGFSRTVVPGDHHTLLMPESVNKFAQVLTAALKSTKSTQLQPEFGSLSDSGDSGVSGVELVYDSSVTLDSASPTLVQGTFAQGALTEIQVEACIVIATFNRKDSLRLLLNDLAEQVTTDPFEVVVVNDGGTVNVRSEIPEGLPFRVRLVNRPNGGPATARHTGITLTTAPIVMIIDDDMRVAPSFLAAHVSAHHGGAQVVYGLIKGERIEGQNEPLFTQFHQKHIDLWLEECRNGATPRGDRLCTGNVSFRLEDYLKVGGFDQSLVRCEDRDLGVRFEILGASFAYSEHAESRHRSDHVDVNQWRRRSAIYGQSDLLISRKHPGRHDLSPWSFLQVLPTVAWPLLIGVALVPQAAQPVGRGIYKLASVFNKAGLTSVAVKLAGLTYGVDYYRGAGTEWGSPSRALKAFRIWRHNSASQGQTEFRKQRGAV